MLPMPSPSILLRVGILLTTILLLYVTWQSISIYSSQTPSSLWSQYFPSSNSLTSHSPLHDTSNILLILKTGASVISSRLPGHINTTLPIAQNLLLLSSRSHNFSGYPVQDILVNVSSTIRDTHEDFEIYQQLQKLSQEEKDTKEAIAELSGGKAWDLDKWKFMPMLFESYRHVEEKEEVEWFVMMEADTSLSWTNLVWWLSTLDPRKPRYMGAPNFCVVEPCKGQLFAHGGSGIVWSRSAVEKVVEVREKEGIEVYDRRWEAVTSATCCGDVVLAEAFQEAGVNMTKAGPMLQGGSLEDYIWTQRDWCRPPVTWHHVTSDEVEDIHDFSERWAREQKWGIPYTFSDVYQEFHAGRRRSERVFWDNKSRTPGNGTTKAGCRNACNAEKSCIQWMFASDEKSSSCMFGEQFSIGKEIEDKGDDQKGTGNWTSGWIQEKFERVIKEFGPC